MVATQQNSNPKKAIIVAKYFIRKNKEDEKGLDKLKLQKLLYYAQAWNLVINKEPLFSEKIEAWIHGPVVPEVWQHFKDIDFNNLNCEIPEKEFDVFAEKEKEVLEEIWQVYGKYDGEYLEVLTHNETPWQEARRGLADNQSSQNEISLDSMQRYYSAKREVSETK